MHTRTLIATLVIATGALAASAVVAPGFAQTQAAAQATAPTLNIAQVHARLEVAGYREIDEIERKRDHYEVKALSADGRRVELKVDPATAEVRKSEPKHDRRSADRPAPVATVLLSIAQLHDRLQAAGYPRIDKIERERDRIEVKAIDAQGRRVELDVDPVTAQVRKVEAKS